MERRDPLAAISGAIMLIGIAVLLLWDAAGFWPWILAVIGLSALPAGLARAGVPSGLMPATWLVGLAALFAADLIWPGILILLGLTIIAGAVVRRGR
jgi:hypothetical protein